MASLWMVRYVPAGALDLGPAGRERAARVAGPFPSRDGARDHGFELIASGAALSCAVELRAVGTQSWCRE